MLHRSTDPQAGWPRAESTAVSIRKPCHATLDLIRRFRNDLIKDFLDERILRRYAAVRFDLGEISPERMECIRRHFKELLISPIDLVHYQALIDNLTREGPRSINSDEEKLFYIELDRNLRQHLY